MSLLATLVVALTLTGAPVRTVSHDSLRNELADRQQNLAGTWELAAPAAGVRCSAVVPGDNATALLKAGILQDPFARAQEESAQWIGDVDWIFSRTFDADPALLDRNRILLEFDAIDTAATIRLNGRDLATVTNEFRRWRFDVKKFLQPSGNRLEVQIAAPRRVAEEAWLRLTTPSPTRGIGPDYDIRSWGCTSCRAINALRKCQCSFGWDWGLSLPVSGLYGNVRLLGIDQQELRYAWAESTLNDDGSAEVTVRFERGANPDAAQTNPAQVVFDGEARWTEPGTDFLTFHIDRPELWWPNGMGAQKLYPWSVTLDGQTIDGRVGIRTFELVREKDGEGESFGFRVNGKDLFAKGVDWIPCDAFPSRRTPERIRRLLADTAAANVNCVRVWGGGVYESEAFYEACDELGLLVWQDFMFACARYPAKAEFLNEIAAEAEHQVKRLNRHSSVVLWCGDNECIAAVREPCVYRMDWVAWNGTLANAVAREAAKGVAWWPSSPCAGPGLFTYNETTGESGDTHYWGVWHGSLDFHGYRKIKPRFVSEFGYQSFPSLPTVRTFAEPGDFDTASGVMRAHQKNDGGNARMERMMASLFPPPRDFAAKLYLSQVQQALAIEVAVASWRSQWPCCRGTIVWQLNDWWPVASWSSLEYDGRWKPLHYAMRRFYAENFDAVGRDAELHDLDFKTKPLPQANVRIVSVIAREDGAYDVTVACDAKALFVWLEDPEDAQTRFDDNLVDLTPGTHVFRCVPGRPATADALASRLTVRDLSSSTVHELAPGTARVRVDAHEAGAELPNVASVMTLWNARRERWESNDDYPITNFVRYAEMMTITGGNAERDLFLDPANTNVLDDYNFAPLVAVCRDALKLGIKPYLKLGNVPVKFTAGCDVRRRKKGGKDGGAYGFNVRPPDDYAVYGRYMRACAAALREAFGREEVRSWRFAVLTEANNASGNFDGGWFCQQGESREETCRATQDAFVRLYDTTREAFEAELGDGLVFGTHLLDPKAEMNSFGHEDVLRRCTPLNLLPISYYLDSPDHDNVRAGVDFPGLLDLRTSIGSSRKVLVGVDEGRICYSHPGTSSRDLRTREVGHSYQAAFTLRLAKTVIDAQGDYIASWGYFAGTNACFTGVPTFGYFTARELARFGGLRRVPAEVTGEMPSKKEELTALSAVAPDGSTVRVAVARFRDRLLFTEPFETEVEVVLPEALAKERTLALERLTLDDRTNWFVDWLADRKRENITDLAFWASPDDANPYLSLDDPEARRIFAEHESAYSAKAARVKPVRMEVFVEHDGSRAFVRLPVDFIGNGAVYLKLTADQGRIGGSLD